MPINFRLLWVYKMGINHRRGDTFFPHMILRKQDDMWQMNISVRSLDFPIFNLHKFLFFFKGDSFLTLLTSFPPQSSPANDRDISPIIAIITIDSFDNSF